MKMQRKSQLIGISQPIVKTKTVCTLHETLSGRSPKKENKTHTKTNDEELIVGTSVCWDFFSLSHNIKKTHYNF